MAQCISAIKYQTWVRWILYYCELGNEDTFLGTVMLNHIARIFRHLYFRGKIKVGELNHSFHGISWWIQKMVMSTVICAVLKSTSRLRHWKMWQRMTAWNSKIFIPIRFLKRRDHAVFSSKTNQIWINFRTECNSQRKNWINKNKTKNIHFVFQVPNNRTRPNQAKSQTEWNIENSFFFYF